jgi:hypothetical protein
MPYKVCIRVIRTGSRDLFVSIFFVKKIFISPIDVRAKISQFFLIFIRIIRIWNQLPGVFIAKESNSQVNSPPGSCHSRCGLEGIWPKLVYTKTCWFQIHQEVKTPKCMFITGESILPLLSIYHRGGETARCIPPGSRDRPVYTTGESRPLGVYHRGVETARCIPPGSRDHSVYTTGESRPLGVYHRGVETARCITPGSRDRPVCNNQGIVMDIGESFYPFWQDRQK